MGKGKELADVLKDALKANTDQIAQETYLYLDDAIKKGTLDAIKSSKKLISTIDKAKKIYKKLFENTLGPYFIGDYVEAELAFEQLRSELLGININYVIAFPAAGKNKEKYDVYLLENLSENKKFNFKNLTLSTKDNRDILQMSKENVKQFLIDNYKLGTTILKQARTKKEKIEKIENGVLYKGRGTQFEENAVLDKINDKTTLGKSILNQSAIIIQQPFSRASSTYVGDVKIGETWYQFKAFTTSYGVDITSRAKLQSQLFYLIKIGDMIISGDLEEYKKLCKNITNKSVTMMAKGISELIF